MMELEGRTLLSTFTGNNTFHQGHLDTLRLAAGTPALNHVVHRADFARVDGGLHNDGSTTRRDVAIRNTTVHLGPGLHGARDVAHTRRVHSRRAATGQILSDNFNGTGGVPKNWVQILGVANDVKETPGNLTITDSTGNSSAIASSLPSSVFSPVGVMTTDQVQINSVNADGNAIFGLIGLSRSGALTGYLAAGIDAHGNVFIVEQAQGIAQTIVPIKVDKNYAGGKMVMNFIIKSKGVEVTAPGYDSGAVPYSALQNFSLKTAFANGAMPALVGASQPTTKGGAASFQSISVVTASEGGKAHRRSR
jgi:hypothetical protein